MTEQQAEYVTEAMDLLHGASVEIQPARAAIVRTNGEFREVEKPAFVKISTAFKAELPNISGDALKVWIFICLSINRYSGKANPGLRTIAAGVKMGVNTVQAALRELEALNLLMVDRQSRKYNIYEAPEYVSANRSEPVSKPDTDAQTVSENAETVSKNGQTVSGVRRDFVLNQINQIEPDTLSQISQSANKEVDFILQSALSPKAIQDAIRDHFKLTPRWQNKYEREWMQWALDEAKVTPEQIQTAADKWRTDKRFNWKVPTLKGINEHWLELSTSEINSTAQMPTRSVNHL